MNEENTTQHDEDNPLGEMNPPGRIKHGARAMALAGLSIGFGIAAAVGPDGGPFPTPPLL